MATYNSLFDEIKSYLNRKDNDTLAQIPGFINKAELQICLECKNVGFVKYVVGNFINGTSVYQKPGRWKRTLSFNYGQGTNINFRKQLVLRDYSYVRYYWPDSSNTGLPLFYSDYGFSDWLIAPTPDDNYPFEVGYLEQVEPLGDINQQNWISIYIPQILLFCALLQATPFVKTDERLQVWEKMYKDGIAALNAEDNQRILDRASNREAD